MNKEQRSLQAQANAILVKDGFFKRNKPKQPRKALTKQQWEKLNPPKPQNRRARRAHLAEEWRQKQRDEGTNK